jgi:DNA primase
MHRLKFLINERKLSPDILSRFGVFYHPNNNCYVFPIHDEYNIPVGRTEYRPDGDLKYKHVLQKTGKPALFNARNLRTRFYGSPIFVTEGIIDALSLEQIGVFAVSPLTAKLNTAVFKVLRRFTDKIILAFDSDSAGQASAEKILDKFKLEKVLYNFVIKGAKDANEMLQKGQEKQLQKQIHEFLRRFK